MSKKLIINADDMGLRESVNRGIVVAHRNGVVTSVSLFVEGEAVSDALARLKENPALGIGIHLNLDKFFTIDHHKGMAVGFADPHPGLEEIKKEIHRQFDVFFSFGFACDHVDSHHHAHINPEVFPLVCEAAKERGIKIVRLPQKFFSNYSEYEPLKKTLDSSGLKYTDHCIEGWYWGNIDENYKVAELLTHPGYGELWREAELAHCCQPQLKQYFLDQNIELAKFSDVI
ncbi:MAG: ChbG/HpnK family deacetylase [Endomicrobiia bacterium]|nr:ChbG/HpnK family deacetylase [Endomicrobiia bacterium]